MEIADTLVVTATLGNRDSLKRTINSVKTIGGERVKHIIVMPLKYCESIRNKFPFVTVLEEPESCKGIYPALNYGLKKYAKDFKYLTYINDDDYWLPNYIKLFEFLDNNQVFDVAYGKTCYVDENDKVIGEQTSSPRYKAFKALLSKNIVLFTQQATLMRSDLFLKLGGFNETFKLVADTNFWIEAIDSRAKFCYINEICAAYTIQEGQLSSNANLQNQEHKMVLLSERRKYSLLPFFEKILFRLYNIRIYTQRLIKNKKIIGTGDLFHK
jgi:hypothetical protein